MNDVLAVLLNYDNAYYTEVAARAVLAQDPPPGLLVVDNGSRAGVLDELRRRLPHEVDLVALPRNLGIPGALAHGMRASLARGAWATLVVLNDTALEPGGLRVLSRRLRDDARLGAVAPLQVRYDDPQRVVTAGSRLHRGPWLVSRRWPGRDRQQVQARSVPVPDYLDFTCLLVRNQVLREVGMPRQEFRFFWDDAEWGIRVRRAGWTLAVEPAAVVRHRVSGTLDARKGGVASYYQHRNRLRAKRVLDGRAGAARVLAQEPLLLAARALLRGADGGGTRTQAKALVDHLRGRPYPPM